MIERLLSILPLLAILGLSALGGWMLSASLFRLRRGEIAFVGFAMGLFIQNWLFNIFAHWFAFETSAWLAAIIVLLSGALATSHLASRISHLASRISEAWHLIRDSLPLWLLFALLAYIFYSTGRGLGLFDDYQNLPTISLMAAGDIPPHFALDPSLPFGYHYFLLLLAAQFMRLGDTFPWIALDAARALTISLTLVLTALWAGRVTNSRIAALAAALIVAFASGTRWMLLLLPAKLVEIISSHITLIGSSSLIADNLAHALLLPWRIEGVGPMPFPFAFTSGVNPPLIMSYGGSGAAGGVILLILLITAPRWRHWTAVIPTTILLAAYSLASDAGYGIFGLGLLFTAIAWAITHRSLKLPRTLWLWLGAAALSALFSILQGGMFTELVRGLVSKQESYFHVTGSAVFPPVVVSGHFGALSLGSPSQALVALLEMGPLIVLFPLVLWLTRKMFRRGRWYETALLATATLGLPASFVVMDGEYLTTTSRLMGGLFLITTLYAVPLLWFWARRRSDSWKAGLLALGFASMLSGFLLFGTELIAVQKPVLAPFLNQIDAQVAADYWNQLPPNALVFDFYPPRAPTLFGRFTASSHTWYVPTPEWEALARDPSPLSLRMSGFDYVYIDADQWSRLSDGARAAFQSACVKVVAKYEGIHSEEDYTKDFRLLLDIRDCE